MKLLSLVLATLLVSSSDAANTPIRMQTGKAEDFCTNHFFKRVANMTTMADDVQTDETGNLNDENTDPDAPNVVLVAGFESFNKDVYQQAAARLRDEIKMNVQVFADLLHSKA